MATNIEWTHRPGTVGEVWNPLVGCTMIAAGCRNCYAAAMLHRFNPHNIPDFRASTPGPHVKLLEDKLLKPYDWKRPRTVFVNSMSDLYHEEVPDSFIDKVWGVMHELPQHTFLVLTKRSERMRDHRYQVDPLPNVWLGMSIATRSDVERNLPLLIDTPAAKRFLSYEPALEMVDLPPYIAAWHDDGDAGVYYAFPPFARTIDWIIVGGESGPHARPFDLGWARSIIEQSRVANVDVFVKQLGSRPVWNPGGHRRGVELKDPKGGNPEEWPADLRVRQWPA